MVKSPYSFTKALKWLGAVALLLALMSSIATIWNVVRPPIEPKTLPRVINDITQLNPITVDDVIIPKTNEEIIEAVKKHAGPISIGGARHSMGGQIATTGALYIDMREFNKILAVSPTDKTITVQAGTRWRQIQERIDPENLSVAIMQTYANFTVGGSLSVNAHGRYVGRGPIILSVKSLKIVLADGSLVEASPNQNMDIFNGVIGGYGGLGVILEATLNLADNVKVKRHDQTMPIDIYRQYFLDSIQNSSAVFHNADIYPDAYKTVRAVTYVPTNEKETVPDRLIPAKRSYRFRRFGYWVVSEMPFGKISRQYLFDPIEYRDDPVSWRNYEASYDTAELEPTSRASATYVLEEYFVPVNRFDEFVPRMREVLQSHHVNVVNVSIRHAKQDPGSLLAWARTDVFAFVIYYKQRTNAAAQKEVDVWTRELIDAALSVDGSYYLPYQLHATEKQFLRAYPRAPEFFALKHRLDATNKFRSELWNKYYHDR